MDTLIKSENPARQEWDFPFAEFFSDGRPVEIEIGCGKGRFLLTRAAQCPDNNFLGVDRAGRWMKIGQQRGVKRSLDNLRFLKADVRAVLAEGVPDGRVRIFHVYFPDPWPKRRHRKRRLITPEFVELLYRRLEAGGLVEMATDDEDYFRHMKAAVAAGRVAWEKVSESVNQRFLDAGVMTNYEAKYHAAGKPLYYLELKKP